MGAPTLKLAAASMRAKPIWRSFAHSSHPVQELVRHEICSALPPPADAPAGVHCLVTRPSLQAVFPAHATNSLVHAVEAFKELKVQRILKPDQQDHWSVMHELTFAEAGTEGGLLQAHLATAPARGWLRLSEVRAAWLQRDLLGAEVGADLEAVLAALPAEWRAEVRRGENPEPEWECVSPAEGQRPAVFRGRDLGTATEGEMRLWELWPSGLLKPLGFPSVVGSPSSLPAALVVWRPKPQRSWTRAEIVAERAQGILEADQRVGVREPLLVGVWADLQLDPRVFGVPECPGCRECSLLDMTAARARKALAHLQLASAAPDSEGFILGYKEEAAAFPLSWRQAPAGEDGSLETLPLEALGRLGLQGEEEKWRRSAVALAQHHSDAGEAWPINQPAGWVVDPAARAPPRPNPADREAARLAQQEADKAADAARALQALPSGYAAIWRRLADPTMHRPFRATMWRVQHARLGCGAFLAHTRSGGARRAGLSASALGVPAETARCKASCCSGLAEPSLESISHALLFCPEVAPAIVWLRETWAALANVDPSSVPSSAAVLLADNIDSWKGGPAGKQAQQLWSRLRVAVLGAIWQARCERDEGSLQPGVSLARRAASLALDSVGGGLRRDWDRVAQAQPADLPPVCAAWFRGFDLALPLKKFEQVWATPPIFCQMKEEAGLPPALEIFLGGPACPPLPA